MNSRVKTVAAFVLGFLSALLVTGSARYAAAEKSTPQAPAVAPATPESPRVANIAIEVTDLQATVGDLDRFFGMKFRTGNNDALNLAIGVEPGNPLELVQPRVDHPQVMNYWRPPLAAVNVHVDNLGETLGQLRQAGFRPAFEIKFTWLDEVFLQDFHGLPMIISKQSAPQPFNHEQPVVTVLNGEWPAKQ